MPFAVMPNDAWPSLIAVTARPRVRRALAWLAAALVAFSAIGFLILPLVAKPVLEHALSNALARKVTIAHLDCALWERELGSDDELQG